jgi:hypothetical protein
MASHFERRKFLATLGGAAAWPLAARAQQPARLPLVAILRSEVAGDSEGLRKAALVQGLQALGWTEGRNVRIEYRFGSGDAERVRKYSAELVTLGFPSMVISLE